jgi:hypothetical protein
MTHNNYHIRLGEIEMVTYGEVTSLVYVFEKDREIKVKNTDLCTRQQWLEAGVQEMQQIQERDAFINSKGDWFGYGDQASYQRACLGTKWAK